MHDFSITGMVGERRTLRQKIMYWMTSRADGIITLSEQEAGRLKEMFPHLASRIEYITFGADPSFFKPLEGSRERQVFAAGLDPDRDWGTLMKACSDLDVQLLFATRRSRLERFQPLPSFVTQRQFTVRDLAITYARSQIAVLPLDTRSGLNDAMGCSTLFEMMMSGCAIVATDTHTIRSYITHDENGLLVPERDPESLRAVIERLLNDEALRERLGNNARAYATERLDAEKLAKKLAGYFKKLMHE